VVVVESEFSDRLRLSFSLALAKANKGPAKKLRSTQRIFAFIARKKPKNILLSYHNLSSISIPPKPPCLSISKTTVMDIPTCDPQFLQNNHTSNK
jgi:hypothetical protein